MKQIQLKDAFPPMDEGFERAANRAFGQIREEKQMKYTKKFSLALVMLLVLALAGTAMAVGYSRLRQELEGINATGAMDAVKEVGQSTVVDGCTVTVRETLVEGSAAWVTLEVMTPDDRPMLMTYWENSDDVLFMPSIQETMLMIGGEYGHEVTIENDDWDGGDISHVLVDLELAFAEPVGEIAVRTDGWIDEDKEKADPADDHLNVYAKVAGGNVVYVGDWVSFENVAEEENWNTVWNENVLTKMEQAGIIKNICRVTVPIELKAADEGGYMRHNVKQSEFQFDGYKVVVDEVSFGEVDGTLHLCVIPERDMEMMTMENNDPLWRHYKLYDTETGEEFMTSNGGGTVEDENGKVYYEQHLHVRNMGAHSDIIRVVPNKQGTFEPDDEGEFVIELLP